MIRPTTFGAITLLVWLCLTFSVLVGLGVLP